MMAVLLNTGVVSRTSPRAGSGSGVKASPASTQVLWRLAPGLPSAPFAEHCLPGLLKEMPPALKSLPASESQSWTCLCRECGLGLITIWQEQAQSFNVHAPRQGFCTHKASGGETLRLLGSGHTYGVRILTVVPFLLGAEGQY